MADVNRSLLAAVLVVMFVFLSGLAHSTACLSAGKFAAAMAAAIFAEASMAELTLLRKALVEQNKYTEEEIQSFLSVGKVRRYIPNSVELADRLIAVMDKFRDLRDPRNQVPLLSSQTWHVFLVNLKKVQQGYLSGESSNLLVGANCSISEQ